MREELEGYLRMLEADLEVEADLHGTRTRLATDLRELIVHTTEELTELVTKVTVNTLDNCSTVR
jgi:hypothetical protein